MQGMSLFNRSQFYRALNLCEPNHCASFRKSDGLRTRFSMSVDEDLQDMTLPPLQHIATSARSHGNDLWVVGDVDIAFTFKDYLLHARSLEQRILCAQRIASNDSCHIFASPGRGPVDIPGHDGIPGEAIWEFSSQRPAHYR